MKYCHKLPKLYKTHVIKRPSTSIKSAYVADIIVLNNDTELTTLGHTPSLGCCGLVETGCDVYSYNIKEYNEYVGKKHTDTKCSHRIVIATIYDERIKDNTEKQTTEICIGVAPKMAEKITHNLLKHNQLSFIDVYDFEPEKKVLKSRFDFMGYEHDGTRFILEVKNVPLADFEDITKKERKTKDYSDTNKWKWNDKIAYFPDGYRKKTNAPVSERAIKHLHDLTEIKLQSKKSPSTVQVRCIMLYVIQRTDIKAFTPSVIDPYYREAFKTAIENGVETYAISVEWRENKAYFQREIPIIF